MGVSKIKNMVIAALLLLNVFFLAIVVWNYAEAHAAEEQVRAALSAVARASDIELSRGAIEFRDPLPAIYTVRSVPEEEQVVAAVLGRTEVSVDQSHDAYTYEGPGGTAKFRRSGDFSFTLAENLYTQTAGAVTLARALLSSMEIETLAPVVSGEPGSEVVTAACTVDGVPVFNAEIRFEFEDSSLVRISGVYCVAGGARGDSGSDGAAAISTALVSFLQVVRENGLACREITEITAGYYFFVTAFGEGELVPCWQIDTDAGRFLLNGKTGSLLQHSGIIREST